MVNLRGGRKGPIDLTSELMTLKKKKIYLHQIFGPIFVLKFGI